jgi:hypothetical protein
LLSDDLQLIKPVFQQPEVVYESKNATALLATPRPPKLFRVFSDFYGKSNIGDAGGAMPISVAWDDSTKIAIRFTFEGCWSWEEYHARANEVIALLDQMGHPVDIITDFRTLYVPTGALAHLSVTNEFLRHDNAGVDVLVGASSFIQFIVSVFRRLYPTEGQRLLFSSTIEEARVLLVMQRKLSSPAV